MSRKQWKAEKQFVLDCPICREPALPQQVSDQYGKKGWALIHPGRIATCFVKEGTDAAESVRTDFNGAFGRDVTSIDDKTRTGQISAPSIDPERDTAPIGFTTTRNEGKSWFYTQIDRWENEGGTFSSEWGCTYKD